MSVFEILISPFLLIIEKLFFFSYKVSGNYGVSIVLLSFFISLLLLPVFIFIEKAKKKDDEIKRKMQPFVDEIKRCYKGQERYYYLKTLNRQYGYSQAHALIPILSLLLQIPFFIAAYQFLEGFEHLTGVGFLFIKDLSLPDGLLGSVNILPIAMTLVNLLTAYYYTRDGNVSERWQMLLVAGIFLVLLFNLPSGLVLYWTMNNVFSFSRLFITNPEVFKQGSSIQVSKKNKLLSIKSIFEENKKLAFRIFILATAIIVGSQINWAFNNRFDDLEIRLLVSPFGGVIITAVVLFAYLLYRQYRFLISQIQVNPTVFFSLLCLAIYFYLSSIFYFKEESLILIKSALIVTLLVEAIGLLYFVRMRRRISRKLFFATSYIFSVFIIVQIANLIAGINAAEFSLSILNTRFVVEKASWSGGVESGIIFSLLCIPFYIKYVDCRFSIGFKRQYGMLLLSLLYLLGLIFFWNPIIVYSSYPDNFNFPAVSFFTNNWLPFFICFICSLIVYLILPRVVKSYLLIVFISLAFISFFYSTIIPFNVGTLQVNFYSEEENLIKGLIFYVAEALFLLGIVFGIIKLLKSKKQKLIIAGLIILNLLLISQSLYRGIETGDFFQKKSDKLGSDIETKNELTFSQTEENILLFVIDGAQGWYMHDIVAEDSSLKEIYNGFIYYPNTLAMANYTYASVPSMMAGYDFSIAEMNKISGKTIIEKITQATELFYKNIKDREYFYTTTIQRYSRIDHKKFDCHIPKWDEDWTKMLALGKINEMWYTRLWENALFTCSPLFLKPKIYNNRKWVVKDNPNLNSSDLRKYNFVRVLPKISNANSNQKNFIYVHSLFTHTPWDFISENNELSRDVSPYKNQKWFTYEFAKWIQWMKDNNVYNNTKIILVSDHGPSWWHFQGETDPGSAPIVWKDSVIANLDRFLHLSPMLLVKDFYKTEPLKEDWRLMSNTDVYSIAFDKNDPTKLDSVSRSLPTFYTRWHTDLREREVYEIKEQFIVRDNMYDLNNWQKIE